VLGNFYVDELEIFMRPELEDKLVRAHPLLYRDRYGDMRSTCMVWGFSCNDGWFQLIWDLSQKLEKCIERFVEENADLPCANCGDDAEHHENKIGKCNKTHSLSYSYYPFRAHCIVPRWRRDLINSFRKGKHPAFKHFWKSVWKWFGCKYVNAPFRKLNKLFLFLYEKYGFGYNKQCGCDKFLKDHPCASQVKEKFGGLRFYMTSATNEMWDIISEAEAKSYSICEACGQPGEEYGSGWINTLCPECISEVERENSIPRWQILNNRSPYKNE